MFILNKENTEELKSEEEQGGVNQRGKEEKNCKKIRCKQMSYLANPSILHNKIKQIRDVCLHNFGTCK